MTKRVCLLAATAVAIALVTACGRGPGTEVIQPEPDDTAPSFTDMVADRTYTVGVAITSLTLPPATGGNGALTYTLGPMIPDGLTFDAATRTLSGTPTTAGTYDMTYTAQDGDENTDASDDATQGFKISVEEAQPPDTAPSFTGMVAAQTYTVGVAITSLTLPPATGGNGALTYTLGPMIPDGLTFDAATRMLSGTPTTAGSYPISYAVMDADDNMADSDADSQTFTITVQEPEPTGPPDYSGTWYFKDVVPTTTVAFADDAFTLTVGDGSPLGASPPSSLITKIVVGGTVAVDMESITASNLTMTLTVDTVTIEPEENPVIENIISAVAGGQVMVSIVEDRMTVSGEVVQAIQLLLALETGTIEACRGAPCPAS